MATDIILPHLGESIETATLLAWHRRVGDPVERGEEIGEVETDKAAMAIESPARGVLLAVLVAPGAQVHPGQRIAIVGAVGEVAVEAPPLGVLAEMPPEAPAGPPSAPPPAARPGAQAEDRAPDEVRITPAARARARELGIDVRSVTPGVGGRVTAEDVERHVASAGTPPRVPGHREALTAVRRLTGTRMQQSIRDIPQFAVMADASVDTLLARRTQLADAGIETTLTAMLLLQVARTLRRHPRLNATFDGDGVLLHDVVNINVAVASADGLRVPVIHGADAMPLAVISRRLVEVTVRARDNRLTTADVSAGTFTVSNLGRSAVTRFVPIVNPPQAAILGVGAVRSVIVPGTDGTVRAAAQVSLTVSADHRVLDGVDAAAFLTDLVATIETADLADPERRDP